MNELKAKDNGYLTQVAEVEISERVFVKAVCGVTATAEYWREATPQEIEAWQKWQKEQGVLYSSIVTEGGNYEG